jgi:hypothetical protein
MGLVLHKRYQTGYKSDIFQFFFTGHVNPVAFDSKYSKIKYKIVTTIVKKHLKEPKGVTRRHKKGQMKKDYRKFDYFRRM